MYADDTLTRIRELAEAIRGGSTGPGSLADDLADEVAELDAHLTAGGTPPEAWREGPDAPELDSRSWGWQGDPCTDLDDDDPRHRDEERPAPEGLAAFAHWSTSHDGINVVMDVPDGMPLTVHVNDWRAVNIIIGTHDEPADDED